MSLDKFYWFPGNSYVNHVFFFFFCWLPQLFVYITFAASVGYWHWVHMCGSMRMSKRVLSNFFFIHVFWNAIWQRIAIWQSLSKMHLEVKDIVSKEHLICLFRSFIYFLNSILLFKIHFFSNSSIECVEFYWTCVTHWTCGVLFRKEPDLFKKSHHSFLLNNTD